MTSTTSHFPGTSVVPIFLFVLQYHHRYHLRTIGNTPSLYNPSMILKLILSPYPSKNFYCSDQNPTFYPTTPHFGLPTFHLLLPPNLVLPPLSDLSLSNKLCIKGRSEPSPSFSLLSTGGSQGLTRWPNRYHGKWMDLFNLPLPLNRFFPCSPTPQTQVGRVKCRFLHCGSYRLRVRPTLIPKSLTSLVLV